MPWAQNVSVTGDGTTVDSAVVDRDVVKVEVATGATLTGAVYFTVDGSAPAANGPNTWVLLAGAPNAIVVPCRGRPTVRLLSAAAATVRVTGISAAEDR